MLMIYFVKDMVMSKLIEKIDDTTKDTIWAWFCSWTAWMISL